MTTKNQIRAKLRKARNALSSTEITHRSQRICERIIHLPKYQQATHIACYLAINNEVNLDTLIKHAWQHNKFIYLPVVIESEINVMHFYPYTQQHKLTINHYDIPEPIITELTPIAPKNLELIITPVVGFDEKCNRLGQGSGFYDRYLSYYPQKRTSPTVIGAAYELQKIDNMPKQRWDIALDMIVTEKQIYAL